MAPSSSSSSSSSLLSLPRELRDEIWSLVFANVVFAPFRTFNPSIATCSAICKYSPLAPEHDSPVHRDVFKCLLTCKQMYHEALPAFQRSMCLRVVKAQTLEDIRLCAVTTVGRPNKSSREALENLTITVHLNDENREQWMVEMQALASTFPRLRRLTVHNHMRPPISYVSLVDTIYLVGPLISLPARIEYAIDFAYIENKIMFSSEELGVVWYSDAIDAHKGVIRDCMDDPTFKDRARNADLISMTSRLLEISQAHEQPWVESLVRRRQEREREREAAAAAAAAASS